MEEAGLLNLYVVYQRASYIVMATKLNRWGNSPGLRLPQHIVEWPGTIVYTPVGLWRDHDSGKIPVAPQ